MAPPLYISRDADLDWLIALEFGRVDDGQDPDCWSGVTEELGFLRDAPGGRPVGFKLVGFSTFEPEELDDDEVWEEPRFDAPQLGLANASTGEIVIAARAYFGDGDSLNRLLFKAATNCEGREALRLWRQCLEAGDPMAHFALGYTLYELGLHAEAYRHLRAYTEIAPFGPWNWCWFGKAAAALGHRGEARSAYGRALELESIHGEDTDAAELLAELGPAP